MISLTSKVWYPFIIIRLWCHSTGTLSSSLPTNQQLLHLCAVVSTQPAESVTQPRQPQQQQHHHQHGRSGWISEPGSNFLAYIFTSFFVILIITIAIIIAIYSHTYTCVAIGTVRPNGHEAVRTRCRAIFHIALVTLAVKAPQCLV
uniref:Uncharacterized protein n=1 Tax=Anopheles culicifacies TaxID=139723 RepID=A0A182MHR6_9DIPT